MLLRLESELGLFADLAQFDIVVFIRARRDIGQRAVGDGREFALERENRRFFLGLDRSHAGFQLGDFLLQLVGKRAVLGLHRRADFLGRRVAALLCALRLGDGRAPGVVELDQPRQQGVGSCFIGLAAQEIGAKRLRVFADRFDVVHGAARRRRESGGWNTILLDHTHRENRPFVKKQHGRDKGAHGNDVGRGQNAGHHGDDDDRIAPLFA